MSLTFLLDPSPSTSLPWQSLRHCSLWVELLDLSKLFYGFLYVVTWICQKLYTPFLKVLNGLSKLLATWICLWCYMDVTRLLHVFLALCQTKPSCLLVWPRFQRLLNLLFWKKPFIEPMHSMPWVYCVFGNNFLLHPAFPQYFSIGEPLLTWQLLQDTGYSLCRGWFRKQSFVTWQILGLALHSDRPVGGVWTLFYIHTQLSENNSLWLCRFFSDRRGGWLLRRLGMELDTHSLSWGTGHSSASWGGNFQQLQSDCFAHLRDSHLLTDCLKFLLQQRSFLKRSMDEVSRYKSWDHQWGREYSCSRDPSSRFHFFPAISPSAKTDPEF